MTSLLRKIVAGPRAPHPEANLDLCYVTDNVIATSGPSSTYPSRAYRNPLDALVKFLDSRHGENWAIWEFRAEGTGYPDEAVYGRIKHFPWPDHHPPPFKLIPGIVGSMKEWVHGADGTITADGSKVAPSVHDQREGTGKKVIVVHCKAGKGRSGSMAVSYLISQEGWTKADAIQRFTERRMRPGFGAGVSIPSQLRWLGYVERWTEHGKEYLERAVEVKEIHLWGLREGVKVAVEGFIEEGRKIKTFHVFKKDERDDIGSSTVTESTNGVEQAERDVKSRAATGQDDIVGTNSDKQPKKEEDTPALLSVVSEVMKSQRRSLSIRRSNSKRKSQNSSRSSSKNRRSQLSTSDASPSDAATDSKPTDSDISTPITSTNPSTNKSQTQPAPSSDTTVKTTNTILRPTSPITLPTSDISISLERRAHASYGWAMVTSVAHVWFNVFFEGRGPERLAERREALHRRGASTDKLAADVPEGPEESGVFEIAWDAMDGLKGSARKGARAFDKMQVVWQVNPDLKPSISPVPDAEARDEKQELNKGSSQFPAGDVGQDPSALEPEERGRKDSFASAKEALDESEHGVLITEPSQPGDVQESQPADWKGASVRKAASDIGSPMARRLGPRPEHEHTEAETQERGDANNLAPWKTAKEKLVGEEQPELDESSDEDGIEGIQRGVRLSQSEGSDGKMSGSKV